MNYLFILDQVAAAEYVLPLLTRWINAGSTEFLPVVIALENSSKLLTANRIPHQKIEVLDDGIASEIIESIEPFRACLCAGASPAERIFKNQLRKRMIPYAQFIDFYANYQLRFDQNDSNILADRIFALDSECSDELVKIGVPRERIRIVGQPHFEYLIHEGSTNNKNSGHPKLLWVTQPISKFFGMELGYNQLTVTEQLLKVWSEAQIGMDLEIAVHPSEDLSVYRSMIEFEQINVALTQGVNSNISQYSYISGMFSTVLLNALIQNIPTVSIQLGAVGEDRCMFSKMGVIDRILNVESLRYFVLSLNKNKRPTLNDVANVFRNKFIGSLERLELELKEM